MGKTIIAEDLLISGNLSGKADIDVAGRVNGNISGNSIDILADGQVEGSVEVSTAHVRGRMSGAMQATSVKIHSGAVCHADISAEELETDKGATIKGRLAIAGSD